MDIEEFRSAGHGLVERMAGRFESAPTDRVLPDAEPAAVNALFSYPMPLEEGALEDVLKEIDESLLPFCTQLSSPGYLGLITSSPLPIGALGDMVASALNQNIGVWTLGPSAVAMERQVGRWLCDMVGYGAGSDGHLVSGGMSANLTALKLARDFMTGDKAQEEGITGRFAVYVSEQRHISIDKSVDLVGLGRSSLRLIETDDDFCIDVAALEAAIAQDKKDGVKPGCLIALAGTTNTGSVDDMVALRKIADREGMWLHADAAYGGAMVLSHKFPGLLRGLELSDSAIVDPHKWLFAPVDAGAVLIKDASRLRRSFGLVPAYLTDEFDSGKARFNFFEQTMEQSKRFRALKVWMIFRRYGARRLGEWIDLNVEAVQHMHSLIEKASPFRAACFPKMSALCLRYAPEGKSEELLSKLHADVASAVEKDGRFWIGTTRLKGRTHFRLCAVNLFTRKEHLEELLDLLKRECAKRI